MQFKFSIIDRFYYNFFCVIVPTSWKHAEPEEMDQVFALIRFTLTNLKHEFPSSNFSFRFISFDFSHGTSGNEIEYNGRSLIGFGRAYSHYVIELFFLRFSIF